MPEKYQEESVFNMALAYLKRIDTLLYLCQQAAMAGHIDNWTNNLRGVYREVSVRLTDIEKEEILGSNTTINLQTLTDDIIKEEEANFKSVYFLLNNKMYKAKHKKIIMFLLDALEVKLRKKLQKKGMLLPSKKDPTKAIMDM